jgi:hypothetical protein
MFWNAGCFLARLDATDSIELFSGSGWIKGTNPARATTVFTSGTWVSSVVRVSSGLRHVYIDAFGHSLLGHHAQNETGPWSDSAAIGACQLPVSDSKAFCAGPIIHQEISDPNRPGEMAISYEIGSMGPRAAGTWMTIGRGWSGLKTRDDAELSCFGGTVRALWVVRRWGPSTRTARKT